MYLSIAASMLLAKCMQEVLGSGTWRHTAADGFYLQLVIVYF